MNRLIQGFLCLGIFFTQEHTFAQSKAKLKAEIEALKAKNAELDSKYSQESSAKETVKQQLERIANIEVDEVITANEQPKDIGVGESGWRIELNGTKYKSDLIGQLGTIWIYDNNGQIQPQGAILLSDYKIQPDIINPDKDILFKKFISKGTRLEGSGGAAFVSVTAGMATNQYSQFTINIEGTSLIKPKLSDLKKIAGEANDAFTIAGNKGVYLCTGMHVIRYNSQIFAKSEGNAKISTPVVNIGGDFYAESSETATEFVVVRQLTQLNKQSNGDSAKVISAVTVATSEKGSDPDLKTISKKLAPEEILIYFLNRQPNIEEIQGFQNNPAEFLKKIGKFDSLNDKEKSLIDLSKEKLIKIPEKVSSTNQTL